MSSSIRKYYYAFIASQYLLSISDISKFPLNIYNFLQSSKILISTKTEYERWNNLCNGEKSDLKIKDAKCFYKPDIEIYLIVYDETKPQNRIRFSLAHEFAHIMLGHLKDDRTEMSRGGLDESTYWYFEGAANTFAGNFLAPPVLINERLKDLNEEPRKIISETFELSKASAAWRLNDYKFWLNLKHQKSEQRIHRRYHKLMHPRYCTICKNLFYNPSAKYCPICGYGKIIKKRDENRMFYNDGCKVDENKRAIICSRCGNEEIFGDDKYCKICAAPIVNQCADTDVQVGYDDYRTDSGCGHLLDSNARYCPYCGNKSTYFQEGLLKPWEDAKMEIEAKELEAFNEAAVSSADVDNQNSSNGDNGDFVEIGVDDPLPF